MEVMGKTIDDAAGEAFDKAGKMLGLNYPAGPEIDKKSRNGKVIFNFNKPKINGHDFSFSGLKTSILYFLKDQLKSNPDFIEQNMDDLCASIQQTIVEILVEKTERAAKELNVTQVAIAGGVSANSGLRKAFESMGRKNDWQVFIPEFEYCTDNAGMIAMAAFFKYREGLFADQSRCAHGAVAILMIGQQLLFKVVILLLGNGATFS